MKRRKFVRVATIATAGMYLPITGCKDRDNGLASILSQPNALQHICDAETIRQIGKAYQKLVPGENKETLIELLSPNIGHPINESTDRNLVNSVLEKKSGRTSRKIKPW